MYIVRDRGRYINAFRTYSEAADEVYRLEHHPAYKNGVYTITYEP